MPAPAVTPKRLDLQKSLYLFCCPRPRELELKVFHEKLRPDAKFLGKLVSFLVSLEMRAPFPVMVTGFIRNRQRLVENMVVEAEKESYIVYMYVYTYTRTAKRFSTSF